jgi:uncharacterized protein (TIGR02099 family)
VHASPLLRGVFAWGGRLLLAFYFLVGAIILIGRYVVMPEIAGYRDRIEQELSGAIGLPVKIESVSATWPGLHPLLVINGLHLHDREGRPALAFDQVEAAVGWSSLWHFGLRLHRLEIVAPALDIRRDATGVLFVAGLAVQGGGDNGFADWLLAQGRIVVRDARLTWHDELRGAPALELQHLNFDLRNAGRHHSFGLTAIPPAPVAERLDVRGTLVGHDVADLSGWRGELFADLEQADIAAWTPWLDAPLELTRGTGSVRLWLSFEKLMPTGLTADVRLADVSLRLQADLPELVLNHLAGRLSGRRTDEGYSGEIKHLALLTADDIEMQPTDARLTLNTVKSRESGEFRANGLDLGALAALASHLPLSEDVHARLKSFAPQGRLSGLELSWRGSVDAPQRWQIKGAFDGLALAAYHELPGFTGLSGKLEGDESAGQVHIDSRNARADLPAVFADPTLSLNDLSAEIGWKTRDKQVDLLFSRISFHNPDAHGEISGRYRYTGQGPGEIDLTAKVTNAAGSAVWRYLPLAVGQQTRDWLRTSIIGGHSDSTTLRLKGPLAQFPFRDGKEGIFQVKGTFQGATLKYAEGWPEITAIDGDLLFEGVRMLIRGQRGTILGVGLSEVHAELADLELPEEILTVTGQAKGATQGFLDFIEASPVGEIIDHFTGTMNATGKGELDLKLVLPLRHIADTQVQGRYRFTENQLRVLSDLPPFSAARGEFNFTADRLQAKNLRANFMGAPLTLDVTSISGGGVRVNAAGTLTTQVLRQEYGWRALEHLSGQSPWRATVTVKKHGAGADIRFDSTLEGLSSSLPEPFNKSARDALPLRVESHVEAQRNTLKATLGNHVSVNLLDAGAGWRGRAAIGSVASNSTAPLPANGVTLAITQPQLDVDVWRALLAGNGNGNNGNGKPAPPFPLAALDLKTSEVHLLGRRFHDVQLTGARKDALWRFDLASREAQGKMTWDGTGAGRVTGRMSQFTLPASDSNASANASTAQDSGTTDNKQEMPAIDLVIDDFRLQEKALGEVRVAAENRAGVWQAKLDVKNDAAKMQGTGRWRPSSSAPETALNFKLDVNDAEKLLGRLGLPDSMRRGTAQFEGDLTWAGAPFALNLPSLTGQLKIDAGKGQFKKLEPGVGRLLGVLSLQSLPRRISLDFRDVFSEGFAFDSITGAAAISRGQMHTEGLNLRGPAAKVLLSGNVNLVAETQDLKVRVQPSIGESIAIGAMIANPAIGAAAWVAQKVLNDPLDQAFAFEYAVTGSWSDPKVDKIDRKPPEADFITKPAPP